MTWSQLKMRGACARGLSVLLALTTILSFRPARSAPGDIFTQPAPVLGADPAKATALKVGDASVATQTGVLQFSYPIAVPPGRNGMAPELALSYSSQSSIYGGIASGWSLSIPIITEDHSTGRLRTRSPEVGWQQMLLGEDSAADDRFVSSLAGGQQLVRVTEPWALAGDAYAAYRARHDGAFARYERMLAGQPFRWRVRTTSGVVMRFGDSSVSNQGTAACSSKDPGIISDQYAPLTHVVDAFGNEVRYDYEEGDSGECRIKQIVWGQNPGAGINGPFAKLAFTWTLPAPAPGCANAASLRTGAQYDYRLGRLIVTGASKLTTITATAFPVNTPNSPEHTRQITLGYHAASESCTQRAPLRELASIQESAWGNDAPLVALPPITLTYNPASVLASSPISNGPVWNQSTYRSNNLAWGYRRTDDRWPSVEAMLIDIDGDGLLDRLRNPDAEVGQPMTACRAVWERNTGSGWVHQGEISLPRLKWRGVAQETQQSVGGASQAYRPAIGGQGPSDGFEGCALNGQVTAYKNGDGNGPPGYCHTAPGQGPMPCTPGTYTCPGGTRCPLDASGPASPNYRTYLAYRWLDMDSDGLVDLVAAVHGKIDSYDIERGVTYLGNGAYRDGEQNDYGIPDAGGWPGCPTPFDTCVDPEGALADMHNCGSGPLCSVRWDVVSSVVSGLTQKPCFSVLARAAGDGGGGGFSPSRAPYARCGGLYPWLIYKNQGNGVFASTPLIKYQPVPLESDAGDSAVNGPGVSAQHHAVMDFDGDGILDAVAHPKEWEAGNPDAIFVWLGDGSGGFLPRRYTFPTRPREGADLNALSGTGSVGTTIVESKLGFIDMNGDGLPDHWMTSASGNHNLAFHDGAQQRLIPNGGNPHGERQLPMKPGNVVDFFNLFPPAGMVQSGQTRSRLRIVDVDADGRLDVVDARDSQLRVYWNVGGQLLTLSQAYPHATGTNREGLARRTEAAFSGAASDVEPYTWELKSDLIDLDGNGVPENVTFDSSGFHRVVETTPAPQRLLAQIDNGRGARTDITYAHAHDPSTVVQRPDLTWPDQRPKSSPRAQWVVKSMTTTGDLGLPTSTVGYFYEHPRFGADEDGRFGFRGFENVTTTANSGARTVETFAFDVDKTGRLVKSISFPAETPTKPVSVSKTTWEARVLFSGQVKTFHATLNERFICGNGLSEAQCTNLSSPAETSGYTQTTTTLTALPEAPAVPILWQETATLLRAGTQDANGDRAATSTFHAATGSSQYLVRPLGTIKTQRVSGGMLTYARTAKVWDPTYRMLLRDEVWFDNVDANRAISRFEYDDATGNVTARWKPNQYAAGTTKTSLTYDAKKLFVASELNELAHQRVISHEYGTGATIQVDGPNSRTCVTGPTCPNDATHPIMERVRTRVDGLGRPIERWQTVSANGALFELFKTGTTSYVDTPTTSVPASITSRQLVDVTGSTWMEQKTEIDGLGRPIKTTVFTQGSAPVDHVTTNVYDANGNLRTVSVPDPSQPNQGNANVVTYEYWFDSLGRPTSLRRPDHSGASRSGVNISFDGRRQSAIEVSGASGGPIGESRSMTDAYGRVITIAEKSAADVFQATTYAYGPDDNVISVVDPELNTVTMTHDFAGRRTGITRSGNRTWRYTYDRNGNVVSEITPYLNAPDPLVEPKYTTTIVYDDLDRPKSKLIARRELPLADRRLFGTNLEVFQYDYPFGPEKGRLDLWAAYAPDPQEHVIGSNYDYDGHGNVRTGGSRLKLDGTWHSRFSYRTFNVAGGVVTSRYQDLVGGSNETVTNTHYDARGLPSKIVVSGTPALTIAEQTRNVAGHVVKRRTNLTGPMTFVESNWTYDKLGRVTDQTVQSSLGQVARQSLSYFGTDDVQTLEHFLGTTSRTFTYGYDPRHQINQVSTNTASYFSGAYGYSDAGRFDSVSQARTIVPAPAGADPRLVRDVNYVYAGVDPEHVTALTNTSDGSTYAAYTYDLAGNQLTRSYPATNELFEYTYDGKDQLRRVVRKVSGAVTGSEEYWYDEAGQRRQVLKRDASGAKTEMIWFFAGTQAHYDASMAVTKVYSNLSIGTPVARMERTGSTTTNLEFQFHGLASSTLAAVAQDGTVNASFSYAPFGELLEATNSGGASQGLDAHRRRFSDKFNDAMSDLTYYGARYYDKVSLGWTQADPLYLRVPDLARRSTPRRSQTFMFVLNNPNRYVDPDGLDAKPQHSGNVCNPGTNSNQCGVIDSGPAKYQGGQGTATNKAREQARALTDAAMSGTQGISIYNEDTTDLSSDEEDIVRHWLLKTLTGSESLRKDFWVLLQANETSSSLRGSTVIYLSDGDMNTRYVKDKNRVSSALIYFNPDDTSAVWQGGLFRPGGKPGGESRLLSTGADTGLAHELGHAYLYLTGRWSPDEREDEIRATRRENVYRRESGQMSRDAYTVKENFWGRQQIPDYQRNIHVRISCVHGLRGLHRMLRIFDGERGRRFVPH